MPSVTNTDEMPISQAQPACGMGHNEIAVRLGLLAEDARKGLDHVSSGEADAIEGWLAYGAALNAARRVLSSKKDAIDFVAKWYRWADQQRWRAAQ